MAPSYFGLPVQALAILMIVFGVLIILVPVLLPWLVGMLLIVAGVAWLVGPSGIDTSSFRRGTTRSEGPPPRV